MCSIDLCCRFLIMEAERAPPLQLDTLVLILFLIIRSKLFPARLVSAAAAQAGPLIFLPTYAPPRM